METILIILAVLWVIANPVTYYVYRQYGYQQTRKWNWTLFVVALLMEITVFLAFFVQEPIDLSPIKWLVLLFLLTFVAFAISLIYRYYLPMLGQIGKDKE